MHPAQPSDSPSVFRSAAWVQAWIDTWGKHPALQLIDLGGRSNPLETVYITRQRLKKIIPVNTLSLAGVGCGLISTPRAEYNTLDELITCAGGEKDFFKLIKPLSWQQLYLPDVLQHSSTELHVHQLVQQPTIRLCELKTEPTYAVAISSVDDYLQQLGANTRLAYFNRRKNLARQGDIYFHQYNLGAADDAIAVLNNFHAQRWGRPCYSLESRAFLKNFGARLQDQGGELILQSMQVNSEPVSILVDVIWNNTRYNFQSGYAENKYPKIALGALHMGYAIEQAIANKQVYDFMAGTGKHSDYKKRIATRVQSITTYSLERGFIKTLRQLHQLIQPKARL